MYCNFDNDNPYGYNITNVRYQLLENISSKPNETPLYSNITKSNDSVKNCKQEPSSLFIKNHKYQKINKYQGVLKPSLNYLYNNKKKGRILLKIENSAQRNNTLNKSEIKTSFSTNQNNIKIVNINRPIKKIKHKTSLSISNSNRIALNDLFLSNIKENYLSENNIRSITDRFHYPIYKNDSTQNKVIQYQKNNFNNVTEYYTKSNSSNKQEKSNKRNRTINFNKIINQQENEKDKIYNFMFKKNYVIINKKKKYFGEDEETNKTNKNINNDEEGENNEIQNNYKFSNGSKKMINYINSRCAFLNKALDYIYPRIYEIRNKERVKSYSLGRKKTNYQLY